MVHDVYHAVLICCLVCHIRLSVYDKRFLESSVCYALKLRKVSKFIACLVCIKSKGYLGSCCIIYNLAVCKKLNCCNCSCRPLGKYITVLILPALVYLKLCLFRLNCYCVGIIIVFPVIAYLNPVGSVVGDTLM